MSFYITCDTETFEEIFAETVIAPKTISDAIDYAFHDFSKGFISNFSIFNEDGEVVFESIRRAA